MSAYTVHVSKFNDSLAATRFLSPRKAGMGVCGVSRRAQPTPIPEISGFTAMAPTALRPARSAMREKAAFRTHPLSEI